ncbi:glycoside hydrolase family 31 protein [Actinotalea sp. M2MS4P-6]|uniref:glycoside hydrolase family 31 protein n=1 Tax=Actinotalea sp. M2MS4P-6 TaxID=2983762 RepID=UPI0021E4BDE4|nr:glycoside hydrolase family 31 protein [Actinotalea sp. M2MS4P-6]MCV2393573.1 glycoside hydrolase family 31 protein [Actinotalea sp. M2MS4P-6]
MTVTPGPRPYPLADRVRPAVRGLRARVGEEHLEIDAWRHDVVRVRLSRGGAFDEQPSHAVVAEPLDVEVGTEIDDAGATLTTAALVVRLDLDPFAITVTRTDGSVVLRTEPGSTYASRNDEWTSRRVLAPGEVYGFGERTGGVDRRGRDLVDWNLDVLSPDRAEEFEARWPADDPRADRTSTAFDPYYAGIPFWQHRDSVTGAVAGSFLDNPYRVRFDLTGARAGLEVSADGGQWCEYVLAGPAMADVIEAYTWLTGRCGLPPVWALGHHQCRWKAYTQDEVVALADRMREADVPCDVFWLDIDHMRGYRVFTWDPVAFPDPKALSADLAARGARLITIVDPGIKHDPDWEVYVDALSRDLLCRTEGGDVYLGEVWPGETAFPDFATPEARAWWGELNAAHVASGIAGIWNDMNEPATGVVPPDRMRFDHARASHERFHNQYALLMAMGTVEGLRTTHPDLRTFVLTRSGFAGIQRYAATWTGDNFATWDFLAQSIPMSTGLGLSGQPFVGSDIGGFMGETTPELFTRWMQYGMLTPFARNHQMTGQPDQYPWSFGPDVLDRVRAAVRLRYRLLPYLYAAFVEASLTGMPVQRAMVLADQSDPSLAAVDDAYLLGPNLLVAPVVAPGVTEREVRLPAGRWYDWHTHDWYEGGRSVVVPAPADHIPLLVRAGAVIPMWAEAPASADGHQPKAVELHLVVPGSEPGAPAVVSMLQEDDGVSTAALGGALVRTTFTTTRDAGLVTVAAAVDGEGYPEHRRTTFRLVVHGADPVAVRCDRLPVERDGDGWLLPTGTEPFEVEVLLG